MLSADPESLVAVDGNNHRWVTSFLVPVMASPNASADPAIAFQDPAHLFARDGFHISTSSTRALSGNGGSGASK
jgi:hypothetical protein